VPVGSHPVGDSIASRVLHLLQSLSSKAAASALAAAVSAGVLVWAAVSMDPERILTWFEGGASAVTVVMVFVLQHTQTRQQAALQRKLDEVLLVLPGADERLIKLESSSGDHIATVEQRHADLRDQANG
jgi:low affinity Fe/Cu permease